MELNNVASRREFLKVMPTQELDELLQKELHKENIDDDLVRLILNVLEEREADHPIENDAQVMAAVEQYTAYVEGINVAPEKSIRKWNIVLKVASILVAVGLLLFVVPQAANAESFFEMLARWTDSIFEFFDPDDEDAQPEYVFETDHTGLQQIYDAVVELGVTEPVVPMWVPENFVLQNVQVVEQSSDMTLFAELKRGEQYIYVAIIVHDSDTALKHEKDTNSVTVIEFNDTVHYIMSNLDEHVVTWMIDDVECSMISNCQKQELYKIITSIYLLED